MPKVARPLAPIEISRLTKPGFYSVGHVAGLALQVQSANSRSWILRTTIGNERPDLGLGAYPEIGLKEAKRRALEKKELIRNGIDPRTESRRLEAKLREEQIQQTSFREVAAQYVQKKGSEFKPSNRLKAVKQIISMLEQYVFPVVGDLPVNEVELSHVLRILAPIWQDKTATARRVMYRTEGILDLATVMGYRKGDNPARWRGNLSVLLPSPGRISKTVHHKAMPLGELPGFMQELKQTPGFNERALEFCILTASRPHQLRQALWSDIDMGKALWTIPASRMKQGKAHTVPLSPAALEILRNIPRMVNFDNVFMSPRGGELSVNGMNYALRNKLRRSYSVHGFRSAFKDWSRKHTTYPDEYSELALAHISSDATRSAYARDALTDERRPMMNAWADFCYGIQKSNVLALIR